MTKADLTKSYILKYPQVVMRSKRELAKKLYKDFPHLYKDVESARESVRYVLGQKGKDINGNRVGNKYKEVAEFLNTMEVYSEPKKYDPLKLARGNNNILCLYDVHVPFQDKKALEIAINYGIDQSVNTVLLCGDSFDFFNKSRFIKTTNPATIAQELEECKKFLDLIRIAFPDAHIYFIKGNHEVRWETYLSQHAFMLLDIPDFQFESHFRMTDRKIPVIENGRCIKAGGLNIYHGNEFGCGGGKYPARAILNKRHDNTLFGHFHKTDISTAYNIAKVPVQANSVGCLSELTPDFMPINDWNHGVAHVLTNGEDYELHNLKIINGKIKH